MSTTITPDMHDLINAIDNLSLLIKQKISGEELDSIDGLLNERLLNLTQLSALSSNLPDKKMFLDYFVSVETANQEIRDMINQYRQKIYDTLLNIKNLKLYSNP